MNHRKWSLQHLQICRAPEVRGLPELPRGSCPRCSLVVWRQLVPFSKNFSPISTSSTTSETFDLLLLKMPSTFCTEKAFEILSKTSRKYLVEYRKGLESSQNFEIECEKCYCLILSTELTGRLLLFQKEYFL